MANTITHFGETLSDSERLRKYASAGRLVVILMCLPIGAGAFVNSLNLDEETKPNPVIEEQDIQTVNHDLLPGESNPSDAIIFVK